MRLYNLLILNKILKCNRTMSEQDLLVPSLTSANTWSCRLSLSDDTARAGRLVDLAACQHMELACCHYPQPPVKSPVTELSDSTGIQVYGLW